MNPGRDIRRSQRPPSCLRRQRSEEGSVSVPVVKQHAPSLVSTPPRGSDPPGGLAQPAMTAYTACSNDLTQYLSVIRLLEAPPDVPVVALVRSGLVMLVSGGGVRGPAAAVVVGGLVSVPGLRALLDRVGAVRGGRSLPRLDQRHLVDLDFGIRRVLDEAGLAGDRTFLWSLTDTSTDSRFNSARRASCCTSLTGIFCLTSGTPAHGDEW
ncbi:hypothetical protein EYF80_042272 [Liparis tanakae]|uniref:Uncharacterized protein n=1 Tax=Liparis tanakae TaxID=230148 RepID=A0A4Z2G2P5_9TELE|nr:hypothetical protein EYF80_042272 [Liparis tanakae]